MKIIAGAFKGREFQTPKGFTTHPMADRVKSALFNMLGDINGLTVLDGFGGSGGFSFEALSRGAGHATIIEKARQAVEVIRRNAEELDVKDRVKIINAPSGQWSDRNTDKTFDLIFCNPPFTDLQLATISKLARHLKSMSLMIVCYPGRESAPTVNGVVVVDNRSYGDAALAFYRREN